MKRALIHCLIPLSILLTGIGSYLLSVNLLDSLLAEPNNEARLQKLINQDRIRKNDPVIQGLVKASSSRTQAITNYQKGYGKLIIGATFILFSLSATRELYAYGKSK